MERSTVFGVLWLLGGLAGAVSATYELVTLGRRPDVTFQGPLFGPSWWITQALFPVFFVSAAVVGAGLWRRARWALMGLRVLAPLMLLYTVAYTIFGGERAWWLFLGGLVAVVFAAWSVAFAYGSSNLAI